MGFKKPSEFNSGGFLKPADHMTDLAILLEPKSIRRNCEHTYQGRTSTRDEVTADITFFKTSESLEKGEPSEVIKNATVAHGMLTDALDKVMGEAMVAIIRKVPTKSGSGFVFRDAEADDEAAVERYYDRREAEIAAALDRVPDFD